MAKKITAKKTKTKPKTLNHPKVTILTHPVLQHKLSFLRDKNISSMAFRQIVEEMSQMMAYEATRDLKMEMVTVQTPLEKTESPKIIETFTLVAILRAGLGMLNGMMKILPFATVGHIGIYRDRFVNATVEYYLRLPKDVKNHRVLLLDPMLATGDTACAAIERLKEYGVKQIRLITLLAAPQGIRKIHENFPDVEIFTVSLERELNKKGYILPGMGDAGDRLYDTVHHS
jgi:uracil phosphoribosyltransferase